jgi:uncharacterized membrane protein
MKPSLVIGALLIVLGTVSLLYKSFSYTSEETVVQIGTLKATAEVENEVSVPTAVGVGLIVAGVLIVAIGAGRK